jgi:proteasome assembly chaperone (PAC2) family protein
MTEAIHERTTVPTLRDPVMISAFSAPYKGGATAATALSHLLAQWDAQQVAEFEADECYNYARMRPQVQTVDGQKVVSWPTNAVYLVNPPEAGRSFLILIGMEPSMRWRSFVKGIADFALRLGVKTSVALRAAPGAVSHRQPSHLVGIYSDPVLAEEFGIEASDLPDGALDIGALLNLTLKEAGCRTADIVALEPYYTAGLPDAKAALALLSALSSAFNFAVPAEQLTGAAKAQFEAIEAMVASSEDVQALVQSLERRTSGLLEEAAAPNMHSGELLTDADAENAVAEVEALLKGFGEAGAASVDPSG